MEARAIDRRTLRKRGLLAPAGAGAAEVAGRPDAPTAARLRRINAISATAFVLGGSLFALGAALAQGDVGGPRLAAAVYLVGGFFFTTGAYAALLQVANAPRGDGHLVLVLPASAMVKNMHEAYARLQFGPRGFGVFISGPSKTADIEQSLVIGAHGPRSMTVFVVKDA